MRVTDGLRGNAFWVREIDPSTGGKLEHFATPVFLALVLAFIGSKIILVGVFGKIPAVVSLSVTFGLIAGGVQVSLWKTRGQPALAESTT
jgi:predicted tellurium resistance membrane protein TerC